MRILQVIPFEESVPPKKYGGIELVAHNLIQGLVTKGHDVYTIAAGDSQVPGTLIPFGNQSLRNQYQGEDLERARQYYKYRFPFFVLKQIMQLKPDIVHNHYAWRILSAAELISCPIMTTMHGPLNNPFEQEIYQQFKHTPFVSISDNQRLAQPDLNWVATIYNGIDVPKFTPMAPQERSYFAFLGRTSPEKGLHEICQIIKNTEHQLLIAAKVDSADREYFKTKVKPFIDDKQIKYIGEIGPDQKHDFLRKAKALLLWLNWEEPFGLVVTEAMACGTPVIVNRRGSMPELIDHKKTGFLVKSLEEMKSRLNDAGSLDPEVCRAWVEGRFSTQVMTDHYIHVAEQVIQHHAINQQHSGS